MDIDLKYNLKFSHCLYKYVSIQTLPNKQIHEGWLKSIDPITGHSILITFADDSTEVDEITLIMRNTFEDVSVLKEVDPNMKTAIQNLYAGDTSHLADDAIDRKDLLVSWIKKNRLPIRETENGRALVVCESVTIHPPYKADNCSGSNGRVLMLIRNLVDKTPDSATKTDVSEKMDEGVASLETSSENIVKAVDSSDGHASGV